MTKVVFIMAGGTGGHVYPAVAVAKALLAEGFTPVWLGTAKGLESSVVPAEGFIFEKLNIRGVRGKKLTRLMTLPFELFLSTCQAIKLYKKYRPVLVLGFGGYVSGPGGVAAWLKRVPLVLHEQNAILGMTNRLLSRFAKRVCISFPEVFRGKKAVLTGNPIRKEILDIQKTVSLTSEKPLKILVLGGSQGASFINRLIPESLKDLTIPFDILHQAGKDKTKETQEMYKYYGLPGHVVPFLTAIPKAYAWADLVIGRAGATTITELAVIGSPSILIPYPEAVDDHQTLNANYLAKNGAAVIIPQAEACPKKLAEIITHFSKDRAYLNNMGSIARSLGKSDATRKFVQTCLEVIGKRQKHYFFKKSYNGKN
jgi:UDP-N-acetylglucosamine--N-acetylmuramyl-(pentapeptide) pyrophosphoryl-undecaprenol N-acetylglucosamine transferase